MNRYNILPILSIVILTVFGCNSKVDDPTFAPKQSLYEALKLLNSHDYDAYLDYVDVDSDSTHIEILKQILNQHQTKQEQEKGELTDINVLSAKLTNDTVCTVFYQLLFSDGAKNVSSQKLVKVNDKWKVKLRN